MAIDDRSWQATPHGKAAAAEPASRRAARPGAAARGRYLFFGHVLDTLSRGAAFRGYFARFLGVAAGVIAFAGVVGLLDAWQFTSRQQASGIVGGFAYMLLLAAGIYMVAHAMVIRAGQIAALPDGEFTLIPLCSILCLLAGESYAAFSASVSLGGGVLIWFTQRDAYELLRGVSPFVPRPGGDDFLGGILFIIRGWVRAVVVLTGGYLASELLAAFGRVAESRPPMRAEREQSAPLWQRWVIFPRR